MIKVNYGLYLLKIISKKWGLYIAGLISFAVILITYFMMIKDAESKINFHNYDNALNLDEKILSGLNGNAMALPIVFISLIPFVVYLTWTVFVETNNSTELVVISRKISRPSMLLQRFVIAISILFLNSLLALIAFKVVSTKDNVLNDKDSTSWFVSMFFGYFIASICLMSITLLLSNFMKFISLFMTITAVSLVLPITTVILSSQKNIVTQERLTDDDWNYGVVNNGGISDIDFVEGESEIHEIYGADLKVQNYGAKNELKQTVYKQYSKWDSWMSIASIFNAFSKGKASTHVRDSWTETKSLDSICEFNDENSINIGGIKYMLDHSHMGNFLKKADESEGGGVTLDDSRSWKWNSIVSSGLEAKYSKIYPVYLSMIRNSTHQVQRIKNGRPWFNSMGVPIMETIVDESIPVSEIKNNYDSLVNFLNTNDTYANKYKSLPFIYQSVLINALMNAWTEKTMTMEQKFDQLISQMDEKYVFDNYDKSGFINAQIIDKMNKSRFVPTRMYPKSEKWNNLTQREIAISEKHSFRTKIFRNILASNMQVYEKHYNEEYKPGVSSQIIWLILLLLTIPLSAFIYIRKDLK